MTKDNRSNEKMLKEALELLEKLEALEQLESGSGGRKNKDFLFPFEDSGMIKEKKWLEDNIQNKAI